MNAFVTREGNGRGKTNAYIEGMEESDVGADIFERGLCLPSDNKMTKEEQERIIEIVGRCFGRGKRIDRGKKNSLTETKMDEMT